MNHYYILLFLIIASCETKNNLTEFTATNKYDLYLEEQLLAKKDSSFILYIKYRYSTSQKIDSIKGTWYKGEGNYVFNIDNNKYIARAKNGFLEFLDLELKLKLDNQKLEEPENLSIFHFSRKKYPAKNYSYIENDVNSYELSKTEIEQVDNIIKNCFIENSKDLREYSNYVFQTVPTKTKEDVVVWVYGYCKEPGIHKNFRFKLIDMCDGGNCNIGFRVNLTTKKYSNFNISG